MVVELSGMVRESNRTRDDVVGAALTQVRQ